MLPLHKHIQPTGIILMIIRIFWVRCHCCFRYSGNPTKTVLKVLKKVRKVNQDLSDLMRFPDAPIPDDTNWGNSVCSVTPAVATSFKTVRKYFKYILSCKSNIVTTNKPLTIIYWTHSRFSKPTADKQKYDNQTVAFALLLLPGALLSIPYTLTPFFGRLYLDIMCKYDGIHKTGNTYHNAAIGGPSHSHIGNMHKRISVKCGHLCFWNMLKDRYWSQFLTL